MFYDIVISGLRYWMLRTSFVYYESHSTISSPVFRTTETLGKSRVSAFYTPKYLNRTQSSHPLYEGLHPVCRFPAHGFSHMTVAAQGERR